MEFEVERKWAMPLIRVWLWGSLCLLLTLLDFERHIWLHILLSASLRWQELKKITADADCSHEIKRHLLLGRKVMTKLDSILKSRDITLSMKVHLVKAMVFPVVMYGCESWTIKKAEHQRTDAFELWCWRDSWESLGLQGDQSWVFIGRTDVEAETPILWPPDVKSWLIWKHPDAGKRLKAGEGDDRGWDGWMASPTQRTWVWVDSGSWWWTGRPGVLQFMGSQRVRHDWETELNWWDQMPWS